ncbi:TetR/AcrR family transcriptional regulator [Siccirubricoccus sp. KC 17139]|uniref:TetR/AcrR family transcriptional regulator n=1 Tax=Siccirubricoccus soli TaxID=2899147 RepID=A0ABT1D0B6_9PROT|nr:TetR/AcrR family transcriptional regulator [Siccirubricoccus soli]MCO6415355.1 TetR/AcrR family transcriptional regulator [Siccirubricoccus soli]MCP2681487.1 TetR/AcrR family transcriptional regulator [Siccirubricoccus soli]
MPELSPRAAATRQRILDAATAEFAAHGLAGARVDEIAARAGANKRMLYAHFGNKEELWLVVLETAYAAKRAEERALAVEALPPAEAMRRLVAFNLRYTAAHPEFVALLNQENIHRAAYLQRSEQVPALYSPLLEQLRAVLARGAAEGVFRADVDPVQLYISIVGLGHFYLANLHTLSTIFGAGIGTVEEREVHCIEVVLGYLRP